MGLTHRSTGSRALGRHAPRRTDPGQKVIALAGNPNVGKSTVFNALTGMNQHTGNWPGKTVTSAEGVCTCGGRQYRLVDLPGTYSLMAHSAEEEIARNFLCFSAPDAVCVVCDATCLERNLNLVLQTLEITPRTVVCVNLMDEARRLHIRIDLAALQRQLGVPVAGCSARRKGSAAKIAALWEQVMEPDAALSPAVVRYPDAVEAALRPLCAALRRLDCRGLSPRWLALRLLEQDGSLLEELDRYLGAGFRQDAGLFLAMQQAEKTLAEAGISPEILKDLIVTALMQTAEAIAAAVVTDEGKHYSAADRRLDRILTSRRTGYPIMLALLAFIFWLTLSGANLPSQLLADGLFGLQDRLSTLLLHAGAPLWLHDALVLGIYRVAAWVVSVMLPPMAIFFPLFTLLEDIGYLPRVAYNLDKPLKRCGACGKQALTICMGFGCNAAGVVGCRIIDSPRERLLAILTNNFVPCNGRFPTLVNLILIFFVGTAGGAGRSVLSALMLTGIILLGILATFGVTKLLSRTLLRGVPSSFTLELPPFRRPQVGQVLLRSVCDRTLFVLGRAVTAAAPAGLLLWLMANLTVDGCSLLSLCAAFLDPFARLMGLDGVILIAFILGLPANEIVIPIIQMAYLSQGTLQDPTSLAAMRELFLANGWTPVTALCTMLFSLMHWPCATTLITIKKETGSRKWTALAAVLPTLCGMAACMLVNAVGRLFL